MKLQGSGRELVLLPSRSTQNVIREKKNTVKKLSKRKAMGSAKRRRNSILRKRNRARRCGTRLGFVAEILTRKGKESKGSGKKTPAKGTKWKDKG